MKENTTKESYCLLIKTLIKIKLKKLNNCPMKNLKKMFYKI